MTGFQFDGETIEYLDEGHGPALLLIPGLGGQFAFWNGLVPALAQEFRVLSFNHPKKVHGPDALQDLVFLSLALLDHLSITVCSLVGQSMGGAAAQLLAISAPERIDRIVFSAAWSDPDAYLQRAFGLRLDILEKMGIAAYAKAQILSTFDPDEIARNPQLALEWEHRSVRTSDPEVLSHRIRAILDHDTVEKLSQIHHPSLVIAIDGDQVIPPHLSNRLARNLPEAQFLELSGGGHFKALLDPQGYLQAILPFLRTKPEA